MLTVRQKIKADHETERGEIQISYTVTLAQTHKLRKVRPAIFRAMEAGLPAFKEFLATASANDVNVHDTYNEGLAETPLHSAILVHSFVVVVIPDAHW